MPQIAIPKLVSLRYGNPYCAVCKNTLHPGWLVAYWPTRSGKKNVHCKSCHEARITVLIGRRLRRHRRRQLQPPTTHKEPT